MSERASFLWNPSKIPTIRTAQELLDSAFSRASKVTVEDRDRLRREKKKAQGKLSSTSGFLCGRLQKYVRAFPSLDGLPPFYRDLIDITVGVGKLKEAIGGVDGCRKVISDISGQHNASVRRSNSVERVLEVQRKAYGRISSIVKRVDPHLQFMGSARLELKSIPAVDLDVPTVVVAGAPNVGKSQLVRAVSTGNPRVASYPFTTQRITIGHFDVGYDRYQVIDTPGLLDRDISERNPIELKSISALTHLADCILYLLDPTETCGFTMDSQSNILASVKDAFEGKPVVEVENKSDISTAGSDRLRVSSLTGEGVRELVEMVVKMVHGSRESSSP